MAYIFKNLIAVFGVVLLGMGMVNASSLDCGDEDAKPITIHSAAGTVTKES